VQPTEQKYICIQTLVNPIRMGKKDTGEEYHQQQETYILCNYISFLHKVLPASQSQHEARAYDHLLARAQDFHFKDFSFCL